MLLLHLFRQLLVKVWTVAKKVKMLSGTNDLFAFITVANTLNAKLIEKSIITYLRLKLPASVSTVANTHD